MNASSVTVLLQQAFAALKAQQFARALQYGQQVLAQHEHHADAQMVCGMAHFHQQQMTQAYDHFLAASRLKGKDPAVWRWLMAAAHQAGKVPEVAHLLLSRLRTQLNPLPVALWLPVAEILEQAGYYRELTAWFGETAHALPEGDPAASDPAALAWLHACLAWNNELLNELERAQAHARKSIALDAGGFRANVVLARLALRQNQPDEALAWLEKISDKGLTGVNQGIAANVQAQAMEKKQQFSRAFRLFSRANEAIRRASPARQNEWNPYGMACAQAAAQVDWAALIGTSASSQRPAMAANPAEEPVFLLGFPRAGTTLLEKMLAAHPDIVTIEEKPTLEPVLADMGQALEDPVRLTRMLQNANPAHIEQWRHSYLQQRAQWLPAGNPTPARVIDKLPLNVIHLGLLAWLFPSARFILAIRDPRDVALSCFTQLFQVNEAMRHFLDWRQTAAFLNRCGFAGLAAAPLIAKRIDWHRYEDFVTRPDARARDILGFLQLDWHPRMRHFQKHLSGTNINTPSYHRVTQTIDSSRTARWKNYQSEIETVVDELRPLVTACGYRWD